MMQVIKQFDYSWFEDYEKWCEQNPINVPTSCPDKKEGCAVYHTRKELRKPTYDGFKEWLKSLPKEDDPATTITYGVYYSSIDNPIEGIKTFPQIPKQVPKKITKTYEYDQDGRVIKEIITEE